MPLSWKKLIPAAAVPSTNHSSSCATGETADAWFAAAGDGGGSDAGAPGAGLQDAAPPHRSNRRNRGAADERFGVTRTAACHDTVPPGYGPGAGRRMDRVAAHDSRRSAVAATGASLAAFWASEYSSNPARSIMGQQTISTRSTAFVCGSVQAVALPIRFKDPAGGVPVGWTSSRRHLFPSRIQR